MRALLAQLRIELTLSLRQGEQLLVSLGIPVLVLLFFSFVDVLPADSGGSGGIDALMPGILALGVMSTAMVALGIGTGFERFYRVLKRLGATPLGRGRLVLAKIGMVLVLEVLQLCLLVPVALLAGWAPSPRAALLLPAYVLGTAAFAGIGLTLAGTLSATRNLAVTNAAYLGLLFFGGIIVPPDRLPEAVATVVRLLPTGALAEAFAAATTVDPTGPAWVWAVLVVYAVAMPLLAVRWFRWE